MIKDSKKRASKKTLKSVSALVADKAYFYLSPGDERKKRNILKERHAEHAGVFNRSFQRVSTSYPLSEIKATGV